MARATPAAKRSAPKGRSARGWDNARVGDLAVVEIERGLLRPYRVAPTVIDDWGSVRIQVTDAAGTHDVGELTRGYATIWTAPAAAVDVDRALKLGPWPDRAAAVADLGPLRLPAG